MSEGTSHEEVEVGSLAEETARLFAALTGGAGTKDEGEAHRCPHGWCPVCHVAELVSDHPELVEEVRTAAVQFASSLIELVTKVTSVREEE